MITATPTREIDRLRMRLRRLEIAHRTARHREQRPRSLSDLDRILDLNLPVDQWSRIERTLRP